MTPTPAASANAALAKKAKTVCTPSQSLLSIGGSGFASGGRMNETNIRRKAMGVMKEPRSPSL